MKVFVFQNKEELGKALGKEFATLVKQNPKAILGLATGSSPLETYHAIAKIHQEEGVSFAGVSSFNLDEYLSCPLKDQTYRYFMEENLFSHIDIDRENTHFPSVKELGDYDEEIEAAGGVDFQLLGIGRNGHIGFNEPNTPFDSKTHIVDLTESTREANARFFHNDMNLVPTQAVTMGISTIKKSRRIALIANGTDKAEAIAMLYKGEENPLFPATALIHHPAFELYITADVDEAAKKLM